MPGRLKGRVVGGFRGGSGKVSARVDSERVPGRVFFTAPVLFTRSRPCPPSAAELSTVRNVVKGKGIKICVIKLTTSMGILHSTLDGIA